MPDLKLRGWCELDASGHIEDSVLEVPLPIEAMIHAAKADDAIARALLARHNPVLEARLAERHDEGVLEGFARGVAVRCRARGSSTSDRPAEALGSPGRHVRRRTRVWAMTGEV